MQRLPLFLFLVGVAIFCPALHAQPSILRSFNGAFTGKIGAVHTLAFLLDEKTEQWEAKGKIVGDGLWALQKPMKLGDGHWIMSGAQGGDDNPAAGTTVKDRNPLTRAVGNAGEGTFNRIFQLDTKGRMMYPGADEHDGKLYVGYTRGFEPILAVVPVASLAPEADGVANDVPTQPRSAHWKLNGDNEALVIYGASTQAEGVAGKSLVLDGRSVIELENSAVLNADDNGFTVSLWFNPYDLGAGQQMLVGKNRYSLAERQWGITIEADGRLRAHLQQAGWKTISSDAPLRPGHWHQVVLTIGKQTATLYLNGKAAGSLDLTRPLPATKAPITVGGIWDKGANRQAFRGALDEVRYEPLALTVEEIAADYQPVFITHQVPEPPKHFPLWDETAELPQAADLSELADVEFHVIKKWDKPADGYTFLHGVGLAWHQGKLYASIGHNKGDENTVTEEAQYRVSNDGGKSWGPLQVIDAGEQDNLAVSHGVFLSDKGSLWAFHGAYYGHLQNIHTRAYSLDETTNQWIKHGVVVENGFWALNQPVKMEDGNWIMPGGSFRQYEQPGVHPAAAAISHGDDFTKWDMVRIPVTDEINRMWGESSLFVDGANVYSIARYGSEAQALVSVSKDYGRTWTPTEISNLPMATSKPAAGVLSTGQRYLVCTTARDNGGKRTPLTIAVSRPGENVFSKVFVIRRSELDAVGESAGQLSLSYPCAIEHDGKLYVGYSNNGGRRGNLNSAELAVIPIDALLEDRSVGGSPELVP